MEAQLSPLSVKYTIVGVLEYRLSLIELLGILSGLASVYYATRMSFLTWTVGLINEAIFFSIFYQVQLYSDMLLQIFFVVVTVYGYFQWGKSADSPRSPRLMLPGSRLWSAAAVIGLTLALGTLMGAIHNLFPGIFPTPAAMPFQDGFTAAASIIATVLMARRAIESWAIWICVDLVSVWLYFVRGIPFMGLLYLVFLILAVVGFVRWSKQLSHA